MQGGRAPSGKISRGLPGPPAPPVATLEPEMAANTVQAAMVAMPTPPGRWRVSV